MVSSEKIALEVLGLEPFATIQGDVKRFRKDVLRVGEWIHPATGELLDFNADFLGRLVAATTRWIELGNKVWFPAGHTSDPRDNMGFWSSFVLEGERVFGVLEVQDDEIASKVGKTIQDVSAGIWWDARASTGETFEAVIEHVCGTPCPVIPAQENFVQLAREARVKDTEKKTNLATEPSTAGIELGAAIKLLLGLPQDATDLAVIEAVRTLCFDEESEEEEATDEAAPAEGETGLASDEKDGEDDEGDDEDEDEDEGKDSSKGLATLSRQIDELRRENQRIRSRAAHEKVDLARRRSIELGTPLDEDVRKEAIALFERGDESSQRLGDRLLELALRPTAANGTTLPNPGGRIDEKVDLDRHAALERAYRSQGFNVEKDAKGRITRVSRPEAAKK